MIYIYFYFIKMEQVNDSNNKLHLIKNEEPSPIYQCAKCDKQYKTKKHLIKHQEKCNGLSILACPKCLKVFSNRHNKSAHIKKNNCKQKELLIHTYCNTVVIKFNYIYLMIEREFIELNRNIFKLGKTKQESNKRLSAYPKGSHLMFHMACIDCDKVEKILLNIFSRLFIPMKEYGNEYFQGNHYEMIKIIYNTILINL